MAIQTTCPHCKKVFVLRDHQAGATVRCKQCNNSFTVPSTSPEPSQPPPRDLAAEASAPIQLLADDAVPPPEGVQTAKPPASRPNEPTTTPPRPRPAPDDFDAWDRTTLSREDLRTIAGSQRVILSCLLFYGSVVALQITLMALAPASARPWIALVLVGILLILTVTATVNVFILAIKVHGTGIGILLGLLTLIPCVGLIVLLVIYGTAIGFLRSHGVSAGLFGADPSDPALRDETDHHMPVTPRPPRVPRRRLGDVDSGRIEDDSRNWNDLGRKIVGLGLVLLLILGGAIFAFIMLK